MNLKIKVNRAKFLAACNRANEATGDNNIKPILQCLLLEAEKDTVTVRGTNLEQDVIADCAATVAEGGTVAVFGKDLCKSLKVLEDEDVELIVTSNGLRLFTDMSEYYFPITAEPFPPAFAAPGGVAFTGPGAHLTEAVQWTIFCVEDFTNRHWKMDGLLFDVHQGSLYVVGVGKNSMAMYRTQLTAAKAGRYILPKKVFKMLLPMLATLGSEEPVQFELSPAAAQFRCGQSVVSTRLAEGKPPPWASNHAFVYSKKAVLPAQALRGAIARARVVLADDYSLSVLDVSGGEISIAGDGPGGNTHIEVLAEHSHQDDFKMKIALAMLEDMLRIAGGEKNAEVRGSENEMYPLCVTLAGCDHYKFHQAAGGEAKHESAAS